MNTQLVHESMSGSPLVMSNRLSVLLLASTAGAALMAGLFYTFSAFLMRALFQLPPAQGIRAMQSINVTIITPAFLVVFMGTAVLSLGVCVKALANWSAPGTAYACVGGLLYLVGVMGVTSVCNVPRNDALMALDPECARASLEWARFVSSWTAWNHVRTFASLGSTVAFVLAFRAVR